MDNKKGIILEELLFQDERSLERELNVTISFEMVRKGAFTQRTFTVKNQDGSINTILIKSIRTGEEFGSYSDKYYLNGWEVTATTLLPA